MAKVVDYYVKRTAANEPDLTIGDAQTALTYLQAELKNNQQFSTVSKSAD
ncbi:hypothetical protein H6G94_34730 [Nostoc punctiforme FACHB-252]|uniref:Uncharacterized protein n=1 Tax=Nostoc punctiforme FACHB-252 TaxID=1357509 RepID=A0ABR8HMF4_NOSPU|nr:hypothetical protein [Nostoc punctiforme]MBD2616332.1 hypothetical protein [Nostoc punctiforme FACHB-252]